MKNKNIKIILVLCVVVILTACQNKNESAYNEEGDQDISMEDMEESSSIALPNVTSEEGDNTSSAEEPDAAEDANVSKGVKTDVDSVNIPYIMEDPSYGYYLRDDLTQNENKGLSLQMISSEPNQITDERKWFADNNLSVCRYILPIPSQKQVGNLPPEIDPNWDNLIITSAFYDDTYIYCTYGADYAEGYIMKIYDAQTMKPVYFMDFTNYRYSPVCVEDDYEFVQQRINWATVIDQTLYISNSHNTYAKSSNNENAYITAIDLADMSIRWRSEPLVSNGMTFQILGDVIVCGYGFTDEPDFLYQLDRYTGRIIDKLALKSAPSYILYKDNALYVRTYHTNYIFDVK